MSLLPVGVIFNRSSGIAKRTANSVLNFAASKEIELRRDIRDRDSQCCLPCSSLSRRMIFTPVESSERERDFDDRKLYERKRKRKRRRERRRNRLNVEYGKDDGRMRTKWR